MRLQVIKIRMYRWLRRGLLYTLYLTLIVAVTSFFLLQLPAVQEGLIHRYTRKFSNVLGFKITVGKFYLRWYDQLEIEQLEIKDSEENTMIAVQKLDINFRFMDILEDNNINIDAAKIEGANVYLKTIQESDTSRNLNINIFIDRLNGPPSASANQPPKINIGEINLADADFAYNETESDSIKNGFDYYHFKLGLEADLQAFKVIGDTIQFDVSSLQAKDQKTGLRINNLKTFFLISQTSMEFLNLQLDVGKSFISDTIIFKYKWQADLSDFNRKVTIDARLKKTVIDPANLALFSDGKSPLPIPLELDGNITGKISRFKYQNMQAKLGSTLIEGKLQMDGLPSIAETFIELDVKHGAVNINDLCFLFPENISKAIKPLNQFALKGKFTGFLNDFVANGDFNGTLGRIQSDINLKINKEFVEQSSYTGNLSLQEFRLGQYFKDTATFQNINLIGQIRGTGLTKQSSDFFLNGKISSIGIFGYDYANISTNARFASQLFSGQVTIDDPNLQFNANGSIDLRKGINRVKIQAILDTAQFDKLGFIKDPLAISTYLDIDTKGLQIDSLFGNAKFKNTTVSYKDQSLNLDSINLTSLLEQENRILRLKSSLIDATIRGKYYYSSLFNDIIRLYNEFKLNAKNDKAAIASYYSQKVKSIQGYQANFEIKLNDVNPLATLADIDVAVSKNTKIFGQFSNGLTSFLSGYSQIDTLTIGRTLLLKNELEFSGSKIRDSVNVLAVLSLTSEKQNLSSTFTTQNLFSEIVWNKDHVNFSLDANQVGTTNLVRLKSEIDFLTDSIKIKILPTRIRVLDKEWTVNQKNFFLNNGREWVIH
ncbi:MAG: hypothetical protein ORN54_08180, partial [Cyclobacteriaceae bacterium]|nr:hypothetical protein [Cyclobacteriaceae bacterium]